MIVILPPLAKENNKSKHCRETTCENQRYPPQELGKIHVEILGKKKWLVKKSQVSLIRQKIINFYKKESDCSIFGRKEKSNRIHLQKLGKIIFVYGRLGPNKWPTSGLQFPNKEEKRSSFCLEHVAPITVITCVIQSFTLWRRVEC